MTNDHYHKLQQIFVKAMSLRGDARAAAIDEACGDDAQLRSELISMIRDAEATVDAGDILSDRIAPGKHAVCLLELRNGLLRRMSVPLHT